MVPLFQPIQDLGLLSLGVWYFARKSQKSRGDASLNDSNGGCAAFQTAIPPWARVGFAGADANFTCAFWPSLEGVIPSSWTARQAS